MAAPSVSIVIPVFNQLGFTRLCIEYLIRNSAEEGPELVVVDNASTDGTWEFLLSIGGPFRRVRNETNLGFAKACNQGAREAGGEYLVFLNNDTVPHPGWLRALMASLRADPRIGIVGPKLLYPDGTVQQAGTVFDSDLMPYHIYAGCWGNSPGANKPRFFQTLTAACFLVSKADFRAVGGFDERYVNGLEDVDFCLKIGKAGKGVFLQPGSVVTHFESRTDNRARAIVENVNLFRKTWGRTPRHDDFLYLKQDGMGVMKNPPYEPVFRSHAELADLQREDLRKGDEFISKGNLKGALETYQALYARNRYDPEVLNRLVGLAAKLGQEKAAGEFRKGFERERQARDERRAVEREREPDATEAAAFEQAHGIPDDAPQAGAGQQGRYRIKTPRVVGGHQGAFPCNL